MFFNRLGVIRYRSFEPQRYRASGRNLFTTAIVVWNTVYLDCAITLTSTNNPPEPELLRYLSPLSWEHINLTGNYTWPRTTHRPGRYSPLRRERRA